jgi:hypothetical protein
MKMRLRRYGFLFCSAAILTIAFGAASRAFPQRGAWAGTVTEDKKDSDLALERTRERVKMLDDLYKNAVVSITTRYVSNQDGQPAIMVAKDIFGAMKKQGWHSAKLVDATGEPMSDANAPKTDFEKDAARAMNSGKSYFESVVGEGANRRLLAATLVPVVMQKCTECHNHKKVGEVLGFIRYDIPVK